MEKVLTESQRRKEERNEKVRSLYQEYMDAGSSRMGTRQVLAKQFGVSESTIFYIINGYPNTKKKRRKYTLRKRNAETVNQ